MKTTYIWNEFGQIIKEHVVDTNFTNGSESILQIFKKVLPHAIIPSEDIDFFSHDVEELPPEILSWMGEHLQGAWQICFLDDGTNGNPVLLFELHIDAIYFKMRWS